MATSNLAYFASIEIDNKKYVSNIRYNGLFCIDSRLNKITFLGRFPGYDDNFMGLHSIVKHIGNKLVFFPELGKSVHTFSLTDNTFESYEIDLWEKTEKKCVCGVMDDAEYIYIFPKYCKLPVIKLSKVNFTMESINVLDDVYKNLSDDDVLTMNFQCDSENGYFSIYNNNLLCEVDNEGRVFAHSVNDIKSIKNIVKKNGEFWILDENDLIEWDGREIKRIKNVFSWLPTCPDIAKMLMLNDSEMAILPEREDVLVVVNIEEETVQKYDIPADMLQIVNDETQNWRKYRTLYNDTKYLIIPPVSLKYEIWFDLHNREFVSREYIIEEGHPQFTSKTIYSESIIYGFPEYLEFIKKKNKTKDINESIIGKKIYTDIVGEK